MDQQRTAFVTGSTGFLGLNVVEQLTKAGWKVVALHRVSSNLNYLRRFPVQLAEGDVEDRASLERGIPAGADAVFHVAADVSFWAKNNDRQARCNVDGTRNVVEAALSRGVRNLIHTSTTSVYGFPAGTFDETAPKLGKNSWFCYMRTKTQAEEEVQRGIGRGLHAVMLNPANIVGPYDQTGWARLLRLALANKVFRVPPGSSSFCHAAEVARAHIAAVDRGRSGENYVLGGADATYAELLQTLGVVTGRPVQTKTGRPVVLRTAGRVMGWISRITNREPMVTPESAAFLTANLISRSDKAVRELDYKPLPLRTMIEDWYQWATAEGIVVQHGNP